MTTKIKRLLDKQGRTVAWLAKQTGLSRTYVSDLVNGKQPMTYDFEEKAASALGATLTTVKRYRGRMIRVPRVIEQRPWEIPAETVWDEHERAWKQSWVEEHGQRVITEAADREWRSALVLAGLDPDTRTPLTSREDD